MKSIIRRKILYIVRFCEILHKDRKSTRLNSSHP